MPTYHVQCADRKTGDTYIARIDAASERAAVQLAADKGHMASRVVGHDEPQSPPELRRPPSADPASVLMLEELRAMRAHTQRLERRSRPFSIVRVLLLLILLPVILVAIVWIINGVRDINVYYR